MDFHKLHRPAPRTGMKSYRLAFYLLDLNALGIKFLWGSDPSFDAAAAIPEGAQLSSFGGGARRALT